jgi:hypothetical protein
MEGAAKVVSIQSLFSDIARCHKEIASLEAQRARYSKDRISERGRESLIAVGNRSALEWILDRYKEKKPKDPTIREKFNTYRFADYKEKVIDLLMRVTTVSVRTVAITELMKNVNR